MGNGPSSPCLTIKFAEEVAAYLNRMGVKAHHLHSEIDTIERTEIINALRIGHIDVIVGINPAPGGARSPRSEPRRLFLMRIDKVSFEMNGVSCKRLDGQLETSMGMYCCMVTVCHLPCVQQ